jgi:hypothetical protein
MANEGMPEGVPRILQFEEANAMHLSLETLQEDYIMNSKEPKTPQEPNNNNGDITRQKERKRLLSRLQRTTKNLQEILSNLYEAGVRVKIRSHENNQLTVLFSVEQDAITEEQCRNLYNGIVVDCDIGPGKCCHYVSVIGTIEEIPISG